MSIDKHTRRTIDSILTTNPVVLFMKGTRLHPQCGFSAQTAGILDTLLASYATVNVLEDTALREGIKAYGQWPTIPQLYVNGELIGGCDIVSELFASGELYSALGLEPPTTTAPRIGFSAAALAAVRHALDQESNAVLHLQVNARWESRLTLSSPNAHAIRVDVSGLSVFMDPSTAQRADGLHVDIVDSLQGQTLCFDNPNAPPPVKAMSVTDLRRRLDTGEALRLFDVRDPNERAVASIVAAEPLYETSENEIKGLPSDTPLVFHCHTGVRSRAAAERFRLLGFRDVYNLEGGIEAWSIEIDPSVPRY